MNIMNCPVTGQKILSMGPTGVMKRENYAEVWFVLSDRSRMRVSLSRDAKQQLTESDADEIFRSIKKGWEDALMEKVMPKEKKDEQLLRITNLLYTSIEDRHGEIVLKK